MTTPMTPRITSRVDAITHIPPAALSETPPAPRSCKIELTAQCNFRCTFCARSQMLRKQGHMDLTLFKSLVSEMRECGVEELGLFYLGESLLYPHLEDACRFAKSDCAYPYVFLTTNGSLTTPAKAEGLFRAGLDSLKFSLNYADRDQFVGIARVKPALFDRMISHIKAARAVRDRVLDETGHRCALYASYILYDGEQGERMKALAAELAEYLDEIYELPLYSHGGYVTDQEKQAGMTPSAGNRGRMGGLVPPLPCWALFTEAHITYDGKLAACCFAHDDRFDMADLVHDDFMGGWHSAAFRQLRRAHLEKKIAGTACERCFA